MASRPAIDKPWIQPVQLNNYDLPTSVHPAFTIAVTVKNEPGMKLPDFNDILGEFGDQTSILETLTVPFTINWKCPFDTS